MKDGTRNEMGSSGRVSARVVGWAALSATYGLAALFSIAAFGGEDAIIRIWFANALAVAFLILSPKLSVAAGAGAVLAGCAAANLLGGNGLSVSLLFTGANALGVALGAWLARRYWSPQGEKPLTMAVMARVLGLAGFAAPVAAALVFGALSQLALGWPLAPTAWEWWLGDVVGFALFLPAALLAFERRTARSLTLRRLVRFATVTGLGIAVAAAAIAFAHYPFLFPLLFLLATAAFGRPLETALSSTVIGLVLLYLGSRYLNGGWIGSDDLQLAISFTAILPVLGAMMFDEMRRDRARLAESRQFFRRAMEDSEIGVAVLGMDRRIIEANAALAAILGRSREELINADITAFAHPDDSGIAEDPGMSPLAPTYAFEKRYLRPDGTAVWTHISGSVIFDPDTARPLYLVSQVFDIDARKRAEAAIEAAEMRWDFALASAGQGVWDVDMSAGRTTYSSTWTTMLGYDPGELDGHPDRWISLIHPDDRARVLETDRQHREGLTDFFESEFRMLRKDGSWLWILDRGKIVQRDSAGHMVRAIGTLTDITARKAAEEGLARTARLLAEEKERLRITLASIGDGVICTDADGRITFMNPIAESLTQVSESRALGQPLRTVYISVDEDTGAIQDLSALKGGTASGSSNARAVLVRGDGSQCSIREVVAAIRSAEGAPAGLVIVFQDFSDARALQRQLAHAAAHDALTGLPNRSSFLDMMETAAAEAAASGAAHHLAFVDLDRFKEVNDTSGHAAGDALLRRVAEVLRAGVRREDRVARLGGDEFAVLFRSCEADKAAELADALIAAIKGIAFEWEGRRHTIGASVGIAPVLADTEAIDDAIAAADDACYAAKAAGRGRVRTGIVVPLKRRGTPLARHG